MTSKPIEEKVIELYERVAIQAITPNQARKQFMRLLKDQFLEMIGEDIKFKEDEELFKQQTWFADGYNEAKAELRKKVRKL